jgi:outer membrane protein assembly factor BamD
MAYANQLREAGRTRKALREYRALVYEWPESAEAPAAQLQFANLLFERGQMSDAFTEYQFLVETYPGFFPYDQVIQRQVEIAEQVAAARHGFLFITWSNQEDAIPMFDKIIQNAPTWDRAGKLQFRIGEIYEKTGEYELAIEAFTSLLIRYPASPHAEEAAFRRARCHIELTRYYPNSTDIRARAAMAAAEFLQRFPRSRFGSEVQAYLDTLDRDQARALYATARLYDRTGDHPASAILMYERLLEDYPDSSLAEKARARLAALRPGPHKETHANPP